MVRMRDVLKSVRDIKRPGQENRPSEKESGGGTGGLRFPGPPLRESGAPGEESEQKQYTMKPEEAEAKDTSRDENGTVAKEAPAPSEKSRIENGPYHGAIRAIDSLLQLAKDGEPFDLDEIETFAKTFVDMLRESDQLFLQALSARKTVTSLAQHSANVAVVAIKVAIGLGYSPEKIIEVGIAGMVHEVGMVRVPEDILNKRVELSPSEYEQIKQHPLHGRAILEAVRDEYPYLPDVIVQEHERWNGNGYPFGLKENDISEYAQILGLADTFVALTHMRHYRDNFIAYKAIQSIIERRNLDFSARMIKALIDVISIFPVHSLVKLNNGSIARVIKTNKNYPVRPVIEVVTNARGEKIKEPETVDLSNEPMIYIVSPVLDESAYS